MKSLPSGPWEVLFQRALQAVAEGANSQVCMLLSYVFRESLHVKRFSRCIECSRQCH
jgi:hypothetical protein